MTANYLRLLALALVAIVADARPIVRNIKDEREFDKLIKHHSTETGLPVVVDFYSDSCGPCRMMEPIYKKVAKEYEGRAVFVKVNTATNRQLQGKYRVNSIPTFLFFADGKKKREFAGAGEQQLRQHTKEMVNDAERLNVRLTIEALLGFYATHEPSKAEEDIAELHGKCAKMAKSSDCEGGAAADLAQKLKKKYKAKPELVQKGPKTARGEAKQEEDAGAGASSSSRRRPPPPSGGRTSKPAAPPAAEERQQANLELASLAELEGAVRQRRFDLGLDSSADATPSSSSGQGDEEDEEEEEEEEDEEDSKVLWQPGGEPERVVIIGSGPAGLASAVYAARAGLKPVVVAPPFGGQLMGKGVDVENYPGLLDQTGPSIVTLMMKQAAFFGTRFEEAMVESVDLSVRPFKLTTAPSSPGGGEDGSGGALRTMEAHSVILATGANSRWLGAPGEYELRGGGVSTCATCDGFLFRDKEVVVVGGGDTAMEDALVLARTSSKVTVIHRRESFRASHAMAQRVLGHEKITVLWNSSVEEFEGSPAQGVEGHEDYVFPKLTGVRIKTQGGDGAPATTTTLNCAAAFVAIGHDPNTKIFQGQLDMGSDGYLHVSPGSTATSVEGVFAAGDVADNVYRQAITSAGSGAMASLDAERWLSTTGLDSSKALPTPKSEL